MNDANNPMPHWRRAELDFTMRHRFRERPRSNLPMAIQFCHFDDKTPSDQAIFSLIDSKGFDLGRTSEITGSAQPLSGRPATERLRHDAIGFNEKNRVIIKLG